MAVILRYVVNSNGTTLGMTTADLLEQDGLYFKDLAGTGQLIPYEDWQLPPEERAKGLAGRLSIRQIAGLMMYSAHQMVPAMVLRDTRTAYG